MESELDEFVGGLESGPSSDSLSSEESAGRCWMLEGRMKVQNVSDRYCFEGNEREAS